MDYCAIPKISHDAFIDVIFKIFLNFDLKFRWCKQICSLRKKFHISVTNFRYSTTIRKFQSKTKLSTFLSEKSNCYFYTYSFVKSSSVNLSPSLDALLTFVHNVFSFTTTPGSPAYSI